jgi:hypothetical protein
MEEEEDIAAVVVAVVDSVMAGAEGEVDPEEGVVVCTLLMEIPKTVVAGIKAPTRSSLTCCFS